MRLLETAQELVLEGSTSTSEHIKQTGGFLRPCHTRPDSPWT